MVILNVFGVISQRPNIFQKLFGKMEGKKLFKFGGAVAGLARGGIFAVFFVSLVMVGRGMAYKFKFDDPPNPSVSERVVLIFMEKLK